MGALETIAAELTLIRQLLEVAFSTPAPEQEPICSHPEDQRLALGQTNGWICQLCQHQQNPS